MVNGLVSRARGQYASGMREETDPSAPTALPGYVVGAYAASPAHREWAPKLEDELFHALDSDPRIAALELPWLGRLHPHDDAWLCEHLPERFQVVLTGIPHTMSRLVLDPVFGLASADDAGRTRALELAAELRDDVHRLNNITGRQAVAVVELHSAPRQTGTKEDFARSLEALQAWDWDGAAVVVEHCDAWISGQNPEKGFLTLADEIDALQDAGSPFGVSLNWGRSAIEFRDADRVKEHIALARASGRLAGLVFSGASSSNGFLGAAWTDAHLPLRADEQHRWGDATSLLTAERMAAAAAAAGDGIWLGVKMGWAHASGTVDQRASMIRSALDACDAAVATAHRMPVTN